MTIGTTGIDNVLEDIETYNAWADLIYRSLPEKLFRKVVLTVAILKG